MSRSGIARVVTALTVIIVSLASPASAQEATGPENRALIDITRTGELLTHAKQASEQLFTYSYTDLRKHDAVFAVLSTDEFRAKYTELFADVVSQAGDMKLTVTSTVKDAAVRVLNDDHAEVLVFLDQNSTRGDTNATTAAASMFLVTFRPVDGDWKVSDIDLFEESA
jgi:Mce-associated membrane protein